MSSRVAYLARIAGLSASMAYVSQRGHSRNQRANALPLDRGHGENLDGGVGAPTGIASLLVGLDHLYHDGGRVSVEGDLASPRVGGIRSPEWVDAKMEIGREGNRVGVPVCRCSG